MGSSKKHEIYFLRGAKTGKIRPICPKQAKIQDRRYKFQTWGLFNENRQKFAKKSRNEDINQ